MLINNPVGYGDDAKPADKVAPAEKVAPADESFVLKPFVGLPKEIDSNFFSTLGTLNTQPLKEKPEKLVVPEGLKVVTYIKITIKSNDFYGAITSGKEGKIDGLYLDLNLDSKLEEKPITPSYSYARTNYTNARFNLTTIKIKDAEYGLFVSYYSNKYLNRQTKKEMTYSRVNYGLVNSFVADVKIGKNVRKLVVVDKMADGKINISSRIGDVIFLDANGDGKFAWGREGNEVLDACELIQDKQLFTFKIDMKVKKVFISSKTLTFGKILFKVDGAKNLVMNISKSASYNASQLKVSFKEGVGSVPTGKFYIKSITFNKDGKECKVNIRGYNTSDMIEVSKDKPFKFALNLRMKYTISKYSYGEQVEGQKTYRMYGYVYNRRTIIVNGKESIWDTRAQILVDNKEFAPPMFTVKNAEGKEIIKETIGKPFC